MAKTKFDLGGLAAYRKSLGVNQSAFWSPLGVTQSGGSRYETGRAMPMPTAVLLTLRETGKITDADIEAARKFVQKAKKAG